MNCIQIRNPAGGFASQHQASCALCPETAIAHGYLGFWCGNLCQGHSEKLGRRKDAVIEQDVVIVR